MDQNLQNILSLKDGLTMTKYDESLVKAELRQDRFMLLLILGHWPLSVFLIPYGYGTQIFGLLFGTLICLFAFVAYLFLRRTMLLKIINGLALIAFSSIFIAEQLGRIEMHFHIFGSLAFLLLYRHWKPIVFAGILIAVQHTIFNYCQIYNVKLFGIPLMVFNYGYGLEIIFWHAFWVIFESVILAHISIRNQRQLDANRMLIEKRIEISQELMKEREKALNNFLKVSSQGIFSFGKDLKIDWGYSQECEKLFGMKNLENKSIPILLYRDKKKQKEFREICALFFENNTNSEEVFTLLDKTLLLGEKEISLEYICLDLQRIMCVMTNTTEKKKMRAELKAEQELHEHILKIISNNKFFTSFYQGAEKMFCNLDNILSTEAESTSPEDIQTLILCVHDFKANAGFFGFTKTVEKAHALESLLITNKSPIALRTCLRSEEFDIQCIELKKNFKDNMDFIAHNISEEWVQSFDSLSVSTRGIVRIEEKFREKYPKDKELIQDLQSLYFVRAAEVFQHFVPMAHDLMKKLGKKIKALSIQGGEIIVPKEAFFSLASVLSHIIRNMIDHGIESPEERLAKNKKEEGEICIAIKNEDQKGHYRILLKDDGRGIDLKKVKEVAIEKNLLSSETPTEKELIKLLLCTPLSTHSKVNQISGRGAGLMSVYREVNRLGGEISIQTQKDAGTSFLITIPHAKVIKKRSKKNLKNRPLLVHKQGEKSLC